MLTFYMHPTLAFGTRQSKNGKPSYLPEESDTLPSELRLDSCQSSVIGHPDMHVQAAHKSIINGGNPSVSFRRQLYHICGISWMHQKTVPIVPRTVEERVTFSVAILLDSTVYQSIEKMSSKAKEVMSRAEPCTYC